MRLLLAEIPLKALLLTQVFSSETPPAMYRIDVTLLLLLRSRPCGDMLAQA